MRAKHLQRGCLGDGSANASPYRLYDGTTHRLCPRRYEQPYGAYLTSYSWLLQHHVLPGPGGLYQQPAKWVTAMEIIRGALGEIETQRLNREQDRAERERRKGK